MVLDSILVQNVYLQLEAWGKNVIIFGTDMRSSAHIDNKKKDILSLDFGPRQMKIR